MILAGGVFLAWTASGAWAEVTVTLVVRGADPVVEPVAVAVGSSVLVDLYLAVDESRDPFSDVTLLQFDFSATTDTLDLQSFEWAVSVDSFLFWSGATTGPRGQALCGADDPPCIGLTVEPLLIGTIELVVNDAGTFDAVGSSGLEQSSIAAVEGGGSDRASFTVAAGTLLGGTIELALAEDPTDQTGGDPGAGGGEEPVVDSDGSGGSDVADGTDSDQDGVPDVNDSFPFDPTRSEGDNGAVGMTTVTGVETGAGSQMCGVATVLPTAFLGLILGVFRITRISYRRRPGPGAPAEADGH